MYNKVLIIGETFHKQSGGGITLSNLFNNWPPEKLAVVTTPRSILKSDFNKCVNYYRLGKDEDDSCLFFKIIIKKSDSGRVFEQIKPPNPNILISKSKTEIFKRSILNLFLVFIESLGLNFSCEKYKLSDKLINWIEDFNPDFIYTQLSTLQLIQLTNDLYQFKNRKVIIHIMDDWPKTISEKCLFRKKYWDLTIENKFQKVLDISYKLLTISEGMKEEYQKRYGKSSDVFHNPVDVENWLRGEKSPGLIGKQAFKILYTGRIGKANSKSIFLLVQAIDILRNQSRRNIELYIYSTDSMRFNAKLKEFIHIKKSIPHSAMPELLHSVDLLFLPLDFDKPSIQFAKLSMPTKASEYMISEIPILIFAPKETYLYQHAYENKWAQVVGEFSLKAITESIILLIDNEEIRFSFAENAKEFALSNFDSRIVRKRFEDTFTA